MLETCLGACALSRPSWRKQLRAMGEPLLDAYGPISTHSSTSWSNILDAHSFEELWLSPAT